MNIRGKVWAGLLVPAAISIFCVHTANSGGTGGAISLPRTGQTACFDSSGGTIPCRNSGQDGELQKGVPWPAPRFTANADTTITDNLTGLVWAPNGNILASRDSQWDKRSVTFEGALTWAHALEYVAKLNAEKYLGHDDWRMPNFTELESLENRAEPNTAIWLNGRGFVNAQAGDYYWSSTSNASDASKAWALDMGFGNAKYFSKTTSHFVWPVCGGR